MKEGVKPVEVQNKRHPKRNMISIIIIIVITIGIILYQLADRYLIEHVAWGPFIFPSESVHII
jgi:hypothetical protein